MSNYSNSFTIWGRELPIVDVEMVGILSECAAVSMQDLCYAEDG
jgi:hypothetical protein